MLPRLGILLGWVGSGSVRAALRVLIWAALGLLIGGAWRLAVLRLAALAVLVGGARRLTVLRPAVLRLAALGLAAPIWLVLIRIRARGILTVGTLTGVPLTVGILAVGILSVRTAGGSRHR